MTTVGGPEVEGTVPTITPTGATLIAANVGKTAPTVGKNVVVERAGSRWVFRYDG